MAIQQLTQPILNSVSAFDASNSYEFKFSAIGGAQVVGNKLVISNNKTGVEVYNETQNNLRLFHLLPVKTLSNGEYYNAVIYTVDNAGNLSEPSVPVPFYCYTNPMLSITNIPSGGTIENGTYEFTGSYIQNEGELLDSYEFVLYDSNKNELTNTGVIYYASNNSLSYTFQGMSNDTSYYIELKGYTVNNTNITTGLLSFNVRYILPASFAICDLINDCENGYIQISSNLVAIDGKSNPSPPIYIDDKEVDLTGDDAWVNWDTGFNIKNDFTTRIWGRDFNPYETIVEMVNSEDTTSAPNRIEMKWMLGTVMKKLPYYNRVSGLTLNLNDSLEYPIKNMEISGNDLQLVEESEDIFANLLKEYSLLNSVTGNGVTVKSKQDGSFLIDGTTTASTNLEFIYAFQIGTSVQSTAQVSLDSNETYTLSLSLLQGTLPTGISLNVQTQSGVSAFETVTNVGSISFSGATGIYRGWINIPTGITLENVIIAPQLEKGDTATGYIQNGIASQFESNRPKNINLDLRGNSSQTVSPMANFTYNIIWDVPSPEHPSRIKSCGEYIYGIKRDISTTSPLWERVEDNVNMTANAQIGIAPVQNDFDSVYPYSDIKTVNYDVASKTVTAEIGDSNFKFDGTNGEVLTIIPEMWVKREYKIENGITYEYRWVSNFSQPGYIYVPEFYYGRYDMYVDSNNVGHSFSGYVPAYNRNISDFRNYAKALSTDFCLEDWHRFIIETLYLVEYANNNSQAVLGNGIVSMRISNDDKALLAETNTNRIIINTTGGNAFYVGQTICIGTTTTYSSTVAANRTITAIEDYSSGGITGKAIIFDGATVNIALNNVIWSSAQISGGCDTLGMKSGCLVNDDKHAVIYRGIENIFGNIWKFIDGINIKDNQAYVCYTPADYVSDTFVTPYTQLGYVNSNTSGWAKTLGYDSGNSLVGLTTEIGTSLTTGYCDYYYQNTGNRIALVGGGFSNGASAGLFDWSLYGASGNTYWNFGARLLKYQ